MERLWRRRLNEFLFAFDYFYLPFTQVDSLELKRSKADGLSYRWNSIVGIFPMKLWMLNITLETKSCRIL